MWNWCLAVFFGARGAGARPARPPPPGSATGTARKKVTKKGKEKNNFGYIREYILYDRGIGLHMHITHSVVRRK